MNILGKGFGIPALLGIQLAAWLSFRHSVLPLGLPSFGYVRDSTNCFMLLLSLYPDQIPGDPGHLGSIVEGDTATGWIPTIEQVCRSSWGNSENWALIRCLERAGLVHVLQMRPYCRFYPA